MYRIFNHRDRPMSADEKLAPLAVKQPLLLGMCLEFPLRLVGGLTMLTGESI